MIDWDSIAQEAAALLSDYLKIDTSNPPGNEAPAAEFLHKQMTQRGFSVKRLDAAEKRANVVGKLTGNGRKQPILLYHHMDVVPAEAKDWSVDPFTGEIRDGSVWGRGAIDMKGMGIMQLLALELLQKTMPDRSRDIILLAAADEEKGGVYGTQWLIEHHWQELASEYVWDEGSFGLQDFFDEKPVFAVSVADKKDVWLKLTAHGVAGHSGIPKGDNAAEILLKALTKIMAINSAYESHSITAQLFAKIGELKAFPQSFLLKHLRNPIIFRMLLPTLSGEPSIAATLKDTISITVLKAGEKENVVPATAEATLDVRLLPGHDPLAFMEKLKHLINDDRVDIQALHDTHPGYISDPESDFFTTLRDVLGELVSQSVTAPMISPGTTDSSFFRQKGVQAYGLFPAVITPQDLAGFHNIDEHISIENLRLGTRIFYEVLRRMCM